MGAPRALEHSLFMSLFSPNRALLFAPLGFAPFAGHQIRPNKLADTTTTTADSQGTRMGRPASERALKQMAQECQSLACAALSRVERTPHLRIINTRELRARNSRGDTKVESSRPIGVKRARGRQLNRAKESMSLKW